MNPMPRPIRSTLLLAATLLSAAPALAQSPPQGFPDTALPQSPLRQIIRMQLENRAPAPLAGVPGAEAGRLLGTGRAEGGRGAAATAPGGAGGGFGMAPEGFGADSPAAAAPTGWR